MTHDHSYFFIKIVITFSIYFCSLSDSSTAKSSSLPEPYSNVNKNIITVGSLNADTFLTVKRLPSCGENLTTLASHPPLFDIPGGKGCNQAIAVSKLLRDKANKNKAKSIFWGQFGKDQIGDLLKETLEDFNVDVSPSRKSKNFASGRGYVFVEKESGMVSAVVSGGSNMNGWEDSGESKKNTSSTCWVSKSNIMKVLQEKKCGFMLLQREIPEHINFEMAKAAKSVGVCVLQDIGGEDRFMDLQMLKHCDFLMPNESELRRLTHSMSQQFELPTNHDQSSCTSTQNCPLLPNDGTITTEIKDKIDEIIPLAQTLQNYGAHHILVTLGNAGSILLLKQSESNVSNNAIIYQPPCILPPSTPVVDETGAGDCFRAAFAVALSEQFHDNTNFDISENNNDVDHYKKMRYCMQWASAAGALAVTVPGAVPSIPNRNDVDELCHDSFAAFNDSLSPITIPTATATAPETAKIRGGQGDYNSIDAEKCPLQFGSRLNSMKDQPHLSPTHPQNIRGWVSRQATIQGLELVDFNYPQHFTDWTVNDAKQALQNANLKAGSVCLRYPHEQFQLGAMTHPDPKVRQEAIQITKDAAATAIELGCDEVVVWSAYDGYDYPFQVNHNEKWDQIIEAFRECCDEYPNIKFSLEYKPTDENTRFFTVPSTGAAVLLVNQIDRENMGLTLDVGHMLMSGENPAQSIALAGKKLFGVQLNDGYTRLAAEDGLMFASVHPTMALETIYYLQKIDFKGHLYFDTFPQRTDPVKECEYNIQRVKEFWRAAKRMKELGVQNAGGVMDTHDALGALNLMDEALAYARDQRTKNL